MSYSDVPLRSVWTVLNALHIAGTYVQVRSNGTLPP